MLVAVVEARNDWGLHPLHLAPTSRTVVTLYVVGHADIESKDRCGRAPLHESLRVMGPDAALSLIALGADVCTTSSTRWPVILSAVPPLQETTLITALLEAGAPVDTTYTALNEELSGYTPLLLTLLDADDPDVCMSYVTLLLRWGADPHIRSARGHNAFDVVTKNRRWSPMSSALSEERNAILRLLSSAGDLTAE